MPATVIGFPSTVTCRVAALGKTSVVMMPSRAFQKPREERTPQAARIPACILSQGGNTPILPVEEGSTSFSSVPSVRPTSAQESSARRSPGCPVEALAFPLLTTIAWRRPALTRSWPTSTGAAFTLFVVKAATAVAGTSETTSARSFLPLALIPQATPAKRNPGTTTGCFSTFIRIIPPQRTV